MKSIRNIILIILFLTPIRAFTQERITDVENRSARNISWAISQLLPSPTWLSDMDDSHSSLTFALRWQITPVNISFNTNKYVSPVQFFFVNPMRRYTGSLEIFVQPEIATGSFEYGKYNKLGIGVGSRINIPLKNMGEHLYMSIGGKYTFRKSQIDDRNGYAGIEGGVYAIFGLLGIQANYNFSDRSRYNFGIYIKYW